MQQLSLELFSDLKKKITKDKNKKSTWVTECKNEIQCNCMGTIEMHCE